MYLHPIPTCWLQLRLLLSAALVSRGNQCVLYISGGANSDQTEELAKTGIIVGSAVAGVVVIVTVGLGLYCYLRIHKAKAYWKKR